MRELGSCTCIKEYVRKAIHVTPELAMKAINAYLIDHRTGQSSFRNAESMGLGLESPRRRNVRRPRSEHEQGPSPGWHTQRSVHPDLDGQAEALERQRSSFRRLGDLPSQGITG